MKVVEVDKLKPGMIVAQSVINSDFIVILLANTVLNNKHILILKNLQIPTVTVKDEFDLSKLYQQAMALQNKTSSFVQEFEKLLKLSKKIFEEIKNEGEIKSAVSVLAAKILPMADNPGSINYLFNMNNSNFELAYHSQRVAIFAGIIGKWMHLDWENIRLLVTAAFLHDIGKYRFPAQFLMKHPADLEGVEMQLYKTHSQSGRNLLQGFKFDEPIPSIVFQHHEYMNGTGFPMGIRGKDVHQFAKIIAVADAYDRLMAERPNFTKKTPFDALRLLAKEQYAHYDPFVCMPFITQLKDHLIGSQVKLKDGRNGKVVFFPKDYASLPVIQLEEESELDLNKDSENLIVEYHIE